MLAMHQNGGAANLQTELPFNSNAAVLVVDPVGCYLGEPSALSTTSTSALRATVSSYRSCTIVTEQRHAASGQRGGCLPP